MPLPLEPDDDPVLAPMLRACGPRLQVPAEIAILRPSLRFNRRGRRVFAATTWMNGVTGYVLAPSDFRPGLAIWGFSEGRILAEEEYATPAEWLAELVAGLENAAPGRDPDEHMMRAAVGVKGSNSGLASRGACSTCVRRRVWCETRAARKVAERDLSSLPPK
jgi:hypothetical protein